MSRLSVADIESFRSEGTAESPTRFDPFGIFLKGMLERIVARARIGSIGVVLPSGARIEHRGAEAGPHAQLMIRRWRAIWRLVRAGDVGLAEAYMDGDWWTPDLFAFLNFGLRNEQWLGATTSGSTARNVLSRVQHTFRRNSRRGSRRNIHAHYDIGNAFYTKWLDSAMNYSSALYHDATGTLEDAQCVKIDRALELMDIKGGEKVLEIGCGWGAVAERLTKGCDYTGVTLSDEQLHHAKERLSSTNADLRLQDYRDVTGQFDRIVSIEMFEAVGEAYWKTYFDRLRALLRPDGTAVLQIITIEESRFESYRGAPDFIQKYIFPGGMLPTVNILERLIGQSGLALQRTEFFGDSYALTLAEWQRRFQAAWSSLQDLGFDRRFKRMWEYYLAYCQTGFANGALNVGFYKVVPASAV
ncbi:MAG: class I SAM-dependent methyltransferase [Pseudolabrys sp.]|nr:class I SAM-dependent methyltransferase [Pseudolabrys sp.]